MLKKLLIGTVLVVAISTALAGVLHIPVPVVQPVVKAIQCAVAATDDCPKAADPQPAQ